MSADRSTHPIVHFVGSIPLPDAETVFRTFRARPGGISCACPTARPASARPGFAFCRTCSPQIRRSNTPRTCRRSRFVQWDGKLVREISRLRIKPVGDDPSRRR